MRADVNVYYAGLYLKYQISRYHSVDKGLIAYNLGNAKGLTGSRYQAKVIKEWRKIVNNDKPNMSLPIDSNERKNYPLYRGCLRYFPAALAGVAKTSKLGNDKHNPNEEMHHARSKSADQGDCIIRHLIDTEDLRASLERGDSNVTPQDILNEVNQLAWRALAFSQELHEKFGAPMAPGAKK